MFPRTDAENTFVVIPAFNEQAAVGNVVDELLKYHYRLIIVDDGSKPGLSASVKNKQVYYLRHSVNLGQGAALQTGIEFALLKKAKFIVTFDADGQHDPADIDKMLECLASKQLDIVLGSRFIRTGTVNIASRRKIVLQAARYVNFFFTGLLLTDAHNGLRAMTAGAAQKIKLKENRMSHATEIISIIHQYKLRYEEVPVKIQYTEYSMQKGQSLWNSFRIFFDLLLNKVFK